MSYRKAWGGPRRGAVMVLARGQFFTRLRCFLVGGLGHRPHFPEPPVSLCQRGPDGGKDMTARPCPGWDRHSSHICLRCFVYAALLPSSWGERLCLHETPKQGQWGTGQQRSHGASRRKGRGTFELCRPNPVHPLCVIPTPQRRKLRPESCKGLREPPRGQQGASQHWDPGPGDS